MRRRWTLVLAPVLALALFAVAWLTTGTAGAAVTTHVVKMTNALRFKPKTITIHKGDKVKWKNTSTGINHTSTSATWSSGSIKPGQSFTRQFKKVGEFKYRCKFHKTSGMTGKIIVVA